MEDAGNAPEPRGQAVSDLSEDTTGFGRVELRTAWDLLVRPRIVLDAYMTQGPTGGGRYARPLRFYLALCGILMVVLFLSGGAGAIYTQSAPEMLDPFIALSGRSREMFLAKFDGWVSLVLVPIGAVFYALGTAPLLKWWDRSLGWRDAFRAAFAFLCAGTLLMLPFSPLAYTQTYALLGQALIMLCLIAAFVRMGRWRWWRTRRGAAVKSVVLTLVSYISINIGSIPIFAIGLLGATFGP